MASNVLEYTLSLQDKISTKLGKIAITNDELLNKFAKLETQSKVVSNSFKNMGTSVHTLTQKIDLLKQERDLLPIGSLAAIRKYNSEINRLESKVTKLQTLNGSKVKTWFKDAFSNLPGLATNPLVAVGAGVGVAIKKGMENDTMKANLTTLLGGDMAKTDELYKKISKYAVTSPYEKTDLVEGQKTMMQFGLSADDSFAKLGQIGDIAMGDAEKMKSLSLAFGQVSSAGKLQGQDLMQMINAGFNPLKVISEKTGESMGALKDRMSKGALSAQEVGQAFQWATEKGGLFYQGAEKAGQTMGGKFSTMVDAMTEMLLSVYDLIAPLLMPLIEMVTTVLGQITAGFGWFVSQLKEGNDLITGITVAVLSFAAAWAVYNTYLAITTALQSGLTWAVIQTNLAFLMNPVVLVITAIIAAIAFCVLYVEGWGKAWDYTVQGMKFAFLAYVESFKFAWSTMLNGIMIGLNKIQEGWYKFKNATGLGDEGENNAMIAKIHADTEARKKEVIDGAKKVKDLVVASGTAFVNAGNSLSFKKQKKTTDAINGPAGLAIANPNAPAGGGDKTKDKKHGKKTNDAIATGGTKHNYITLNMKDVIGTISISGKDFKENASEMQRQVEEYVLRALAMATTTAG